MSDALRVASAITDAARILARDLGNGRASSPMGAIEAHGAAVIQAAERIACALDVIAEAIREHVDVIAKEKGA